MENIVDYIIKDIKNIENIKGMQLSKEQEIVKTSVINTGQKIPVCINEFQEIFDGRVRVLGCIASGADTVKATIIKGDDKQNSFDEYVINTVRNNPSAIRKAKMYVNAIKDKNEDQVDEISIQMNVKTSNDEVKLSKAHKSKFLKIYELSPKVQNLADYHNLQINVCYALAQHFSKNKLTEDEILVIIDYIVKNKFSEKKAISYISSQIKKDNKSSKSNTQENLTKQIKQAELDTIEGIKINSNTLIINLKDIDLKKFTEEDFKVLKIHILKFKEYLLSIKSKDLPYSKNAA